jgi:preprotein translocase subunit YajC
MFTNIAYAAEASSQKSATTMDTIQSNLMSFLPMILIFAVFYFLLIRPQEQKRKEHEKLVSSVQKGEKVLTHSGIYGHVERINEKDASVDLEIAKNLVIKISKSSISDIISRNNNQDKK